MKRVRFSVPSIITSILLLDGTYTRLSNGLPYVMDEIRPGRLAFLDRCLRAYFGRATRKDSMMRRVRNAVHLLAVADQQTDQAVGLALGCASMEALVCKDDKDISISNQLAERAAMLLESDRDQRPAAKGFFKKVYDIRSKVLHGVNVEGAAGQLENARYVIAELLRAVTERIDFMGKSGYDPEKPEDFFRELDHLWDRGSDEVPGVSPPLRQPWRAN